MKKIEITSRQTMMFSHDFLNQQIAILGLGFVGSNIASVLTKSLFNFLHIVDFDIVKEHNLLNQYYREEDLGKEKAICLQKRLENDLPSILKAELYCLPFLGKGEEFLKEARKCGYNKDINIYIVAVDTLEGRVEIIKELLKDFDEKNTYIFVGTSSEVLYTGIYKGKKAKKSLEKMIIEYGTSKKENFSQGICGEKSSFYLGNMISSMILGELRKMNNKNLKEYSKEILFSIKENEFVNDFKWFK